MKETLSAVIGPLNFAAQYKHFSPSPAGINATPKASLLKNFQSIMPFAGGYLDEVMAKIKLGIHRIAPSLLEPFKKTSFVARPMHRGSLENFPFIKSDIAA